MRGLPVNLHTQVPHHRRRARMPGLVSKTRSALLIAFTVISFLFFFKSYPTRPDGYSRNYKGQGSSRVAKVSMLYGTDDGPARGIYERALRTHRRHDEQHNYPFHVLREDIVGGYWNKPSYLLSLVVNELAKPLGQRTEWLMWVDADLILLNPSIPLEAFLPPADFPHIHFLGNKDQNGLNTGTFFLHVHEWSVKMLTKVMAYPMFRPDVDLHLSVDQEAMQHVFNESDFATGVLFQPRIWYNTYEFHHAYEGQKGNLLVHFPGLFDDRWSHMSRWLSIVENSPDEWSMPFDKTNYPQNISTYWGSLREAIMTLNKGEDVLAQQGDAAAEVSKTAIENLKKLVLFEADSVEAVVNATIFAQDNIPELAPASKSMRPPLQ